MVSILSSFDRRPKSDSLVAERTGVSPRIAAFRHEAVDPLATRLWPAERERFSINAILNGASQRIAIALDAPRHAAETRRAAQIVGEAGGVEVRTFCIPVTSVQFWLTGCPDSGWAKRRIELAAAEVLQATLSVAPDQRLPVGCIPALRLVDHGQGTLEAILSVERTDEICARALKAGARVVGGQLAALAATRRMPEIEHTILESDRVRARCRLPRGCLSTREEGRSAGSVSGVRRALVTDSRFDSLSVVDRRRFAAAAALNDQVLDGLAAAASGASVSSSAFTEPARAHAARWGRCEPLCRWRFSGDLLRGELCMPVDLAAIGGYLLGDPDRIFRPVRDLVDRVAAMGLISSVAYLRATSLAAGDLEP